MYKVSVIVPIFGVEKYIERCARSLFEQSLDSLEYVFVNDCTMDNSMEILRKVANEYPHRSNQIKVINMPCNSGQAAVRIKGIYSATGEYLIHCDSDDWVDVDMYKKLYETAIEKNADIVDCDYFVTDGYTRRLIQDNFPNEKNSIIRNILNQKSANSLCNKLIKRSIFLENSFKLPNDSNGEDFVLTIQSVCFSKRTFYLNRPLYYYFYNPESITNQNSEIKILQNFKQVYNNIEIVLSFLRERYNHEFEDEIIHLKLIKRNLLLKLLGKYKYLDLWKNTYPEINKKVLVCRSVSSKEKIKFIIAFTGFIVVINNLKYLVNYFRFYFKRNIYLL